MKVKIGGKTVLRISLGYPDFPVDGRFTPYAQ